MKRILLTGGTGFIGRHLLEGLKGEYEVTAPTRQQLNLLDADAVLACLESGKYDVVIHCATQNASRNAAEPKDAVLERTLRMFFNLLRGEEHFGQLLYFGSGAEFDKSQGIRFVAEDSFGERVPQDGYGFAKYIMNQAALHSDKITNLRLFGCFGEYEDWEIRFISNAICKALHGLPVTLRQNTIFDYLYVQDIIPVVQYFIENTPRLRHYNLCSGRRIDLLGIVPLIEQATGRKLQVHVAAKGLNLEYTASNARLMDELPWLRFTPLDEAIGKLYRWYAGRLDQIPKEKLLCDK